MSRDAEPSPEALADYQRRYALFQEWLLRTQASWDLRIPPVPLIRPDHWYTKPLRR